MADNVIGSLADQSTYDPATGMPYPGNAPDYGDLSQRMTNAQQRLAAGLYEAGAMPGRAFGTVPGGPPTPEEEANWGAGTAFGMLGAGRIPGGAPAGAVGAGGAKLVQPEGIFAYHSSPYTFDKFDLSKIGTGEGAQVYGHGIYAAENPAVSGQGGTYWGQFLRRFPEQEQNIAESLKAFGFDRDAVIKQLQDHNAVLQSTPSTAKLVGTGGAIDRTIANNQRDIELLRSDQPVGPRTYEVNINARPEQLLNLDAPLYQQGSRVADAFKNITGMELGPPTGLTGAPDALQFIRSMGQMKSPEYVSAAFNDAGIPGSRYLDQGSRNAGDWHITPPSQTVSGKWMVKSNDYNSKGLHFDTEAAAQAALAEKNNQRTRNYVIFDPSKLDIRKMYAVPGAVGAGAAGMGALATQDNYQSQ